jgi:hypothetical protein
MNPIKKLKDRGRTISRGVVKKGAPAEGGTMPAESKEALINSFDTVKCCAKDESSWDGICEKNTKIEEDVLPSGWRVILMAPCALSDLQTITSKATRDGFLCPEHAAAVERLLWKIPKG